MVLRCPTVFSESTLGPRVRTDPNPLYGASYLKTACKMTTGGWLYYSFKHIREWPSGLGCPLQAHVMGVTAATWRPFAVQHQYCRMQGGCLVLESKP